jgi:CheY-like chemotaxis protein
MSGLKNDSGHRYRMTRQHIVVVNGASDFLNIARDLLEMASYNVTTTNYVPETFDEIVAVEPSLIIIDLAVGTRDGWDLLERLNGDAATRDIPVIVVSTDPALLEKARENTEPLGGRQFLASPFEMDDLYGALQDLIGTA